MEAERRGVAMLRDLAARLFPSEEEAQWAFASVSQLLLPPARTLIATWEQTGHPDTRGLTDRVVALQWLVGAFYAWLTEGLALDREYRAAMQAVAQRVVDWGAQQDPAARPQLERLAQRFGLIVDLAFGDLDGVGEHDG